MRRNIYTDALIRTLLIFVASLLVGGLITALCSCTRKVYVPQERVIMRTDTCFYAQLRVDSVIARDSVAVVQIGDTVYKTKYRDRYRVKQRTDTVYQAAVDSVRVAVPYPVERKLTKWEQTKQDMGGLFLGGMIAAVLAAAVAWIVKLKRIKQ